MVRNTGTTTTRLTSRLTSERRTRLGTGRMAVAALPSDLSAAHCREATLSAGSSHKTVPSAFDDFSDDFDKKYKLPGFKQPLDTYLGEASCLD